MQTTVQTVPEDKTAVLAKCAHEGCTCTTVSGERFCSDYCAGQADAAAAAMHDGCHCGHPECAHTVDVLPTVIAPIPIQ